MRISWIVNSVAVVALLGQFVVGYAQELPWAGGSVPLVPIANGSVANAGGVVGLAPVINAAPGYSPAGYVAQAGHVAPVSFGAEGGCDQCGVSGCSGACGVGGGMGGCGPVCDPGCCTDCCGPRWGVFGEFLYWRARDVDVAYAVQTDNVLRPVPVQTSPVSVLDPDYEPGFRFGAMYYIDGCSSLSATYTFWEAATNNSINGTPVLPLDPMLEHPGVANIGNIWLASVGEYYLALDMVDVDYRTLLYACDGLEIGWLGGVRWAQTQQELRVDYAGNATESINTEVEFSGIGFRTGLECEKWIGCHLSIYGKSSASFLAGETRATYLQTQSFDPVVVNTGWRAGRLATVLDLEVGVAWTSSCDTWRLSAGYIFQGWFNTVQTDEWINAVHTNNYVGLGDSMSLDGLTARLEARF